MIPKRVKYVQSLAGIFYFLALNKKKGEYSPEKTNWKKILKASSFKLSWVVDPFMRKGNVGVAAKNKGRRFIGFETDQDNLLVSMKRIDQS